TQPAVTAHFRVAPASCRLPFFSSLTSPPPLYFRSPFLAPSVPPPQPASYSYLMNSFAAQLTPAEAKRLRLHPAVADVEPDRVVRMTTVQSPEFLKMDTSLWPAAGGQSSAGEGIIIGVIDSGIWPEHPSFADPDPNGAAYSTKPSRWRGVCTKTADFQACNNKLIGARYFLKGAEYTFGKLDESEEFRSARDKVQHGTWCAGAAAGNAGITVTTGGRSYGTASGMAPRARLSVYKALWTIGGYEGTGASSDLIGAAEKAVADGVDVISCSWGGLAMYFQDLPYLRGLKAGVVTAFAAGNEGKPNPSSIWGTLGNVSPFYLTVGASTIGREYKAVLTLGDATTFTGRSLGGTAATGSALPLIMAESALLSGGDQAKARQCYIGHIDRTAVSGKFLVCSVLTRKMTLLLADADLLGAAAILVISGTPKKDLQYRMPYTKTPSIFLPYSRGKTVKSYVQTDSSPTATLSAYTESQSTNAPQVAFFSSTGPPRSARYPPALLIRDFPTNDILKPDVMGPGFLLWSAAPGKAVATAATDAPEFNYWSGTSMSTPHLAGIMALIVQEKPNWSPAQVISAITTTAYTKNKNGQAIQRADGSKANAWDYGGGHVDPTRVLDPGLTFHSAQKQYVNFLMGRDPLRAKKRFWRMGKARPIFPWSINRPSIAACDLAADSGSATACDVACNRTTTQATMPKSLSAGPCVDTEPGFSARRLSRPSALAIPFTSAFRAASAAAMFTSPQSARDPFSLLPDELIVDIFARVGCGAADVSIISLTCRRFRALTRYVPALRFAPFDVASGDHVAATASPARLEELVSRMVLKTRSLQHLHVASALAADGAVSCSCAENDGSGAAERHHHAACAGAGASGSDSNGCCSFCGCHVAAPQQHPREFIFEAWMRHVGPQLQSLVFSRSLQPPPRSGSCAGSCGSTCGAGGMTVNVWENEDLSVHLRHVARHCSSLRSLSLGSLSLSSSLLTCHLPPMRHLEHLSLSWIHASNESLQAVLDASPNLRRLSIFMATGCPRINLRLPATVEHVELAYLRAESCSFRNARALRSLSVRDMFVRSVSVRDAPVLRHVAVASASVLEVAAPDSPLLASLDLKAGSFGWAAIKALVQTAGASLISFSLDFFSAGPGAISAGVFSLTWLAASCPNLKALSFGALPWQLVVSWAAAAGAFRADGGRAQGGYAERGYAERGYEMRADYPWPQLAEIKVRVQEERPEALLLLHTMLCRMPSLRSLQVSLVPGDEEEEEEVEEEEGDEGYEGEEVEGEMEEGMGEEGEMEDEGMEEEWEEEEEKDVNMTGDIEGSMSATAAAPAAAPAVCATAGGATAGAAAECMGAARRQELFVKGLMCLQQRFSHVRVCVPAAAHRSTTM
ncbi:unnamed protein product, partial [Closterium sp. Naga37s-1]